jgi:hypothetical protein
MDELEKMKVLWKEVHENKNIYKQINKNQIMENLTFKSNHVFVKLSNSVKYEYMAIASSIPIMLITAAYVLDGSFKAAAISFAAIMLIYGWYFWSDFKKIQNYAISSASLNEQLSKSIAHLEKFVKTYFTVGMLLWPIVGALYYFMLLFLKSNLLFGITPLLLSILATTFIGYFVQKWYTKNMYGKYIKELKDLQDELKV